MKITTILLIVTLFKVQANSYSQNTKISLDMESVTLEQVLSEIENVTDFKFLFDTKEVNLNRIVSIKEKKKKVSKILKNLFFKTNITYAVLDKQIVLKIKQKKNIKSSLKKIIEVALQTIEITGSVSDKDGFGLPGVSIIVVGTQTGTQTDFDGNYKIKVQKGAILEFSYIGMETVKVVVGNSRMVNITLNDAENALDEVVITALGIKREARSVGYAVAEIDGDELAKAAQVNPVNSLQGKTAGVQVSTTSGGTYGGSRITIRGNSTFNNNSQPIFVVDGVVLDNDISGTNGADWGNQLKNLNSDDFETFSILKGAAATALYGSRALNGVVMITTKKGKKQKGLGVSFSQTTGSRFIYDTVDFQNEYGSGPTAGGFSWAWAGPNATGRDDKHDTSQFFAYDNATGYGTVANNAGEEHAASWGPKFDGQNIIDYDGSIAKWEAQPNNYRDFFDTGFLTNTNIAIEGGGEMNTFRLSLSSFSESGVQPRNDFSKYSMSINGTQDLIKDKLKVSATIHYTRSKAENPVSPGNNSPWFHDGFPRNYNTNKWKNNYLDVDGGIPYPAGNYYNYTRMSKIWMDNLKDENQRVEGSLIAKIDLDLNITKGVKLKLEGNINQYNTNNTFKNFANSKNRLNGGYGIGHNEKFQKSISAKLFLDKQVNDAIRMDLVLGGELWSTRSESSNASTSGGFKVRDLYSLGNSKNNLNATGGIGPVKKINSIYGFYNISYKNDLYLSLTARNDWSSALVYPDGHGNNSYFYPSASLAWVASETFELPEFISFAKLRTSYAIVGNDTAPYRLSTGFVPDNFNANPSLDLFKLENGTAISPDLKPEKKYSFETGMDLRLFNNRVKLDLAYYKDNNKNQIISLPVPTESGISSQLINAGNLQNQGVEIGLDFTIVKNKDWDWSIGVNGTHNRDKIVSLAPGINEFQLYGNPDDSNAGTASYAYVGGNYGDLVTRRGYKFYDGANTENHGKPILWNRNAWSVAYMPGIANKDSLQVMGNMQPDWYGGLNTSLRYKRFRLNAIIDARFGGEIYSADARYGSHQGVLQSSVANRDASNGGITWTSNGQGQNFFGKTYHDGFIPDGVFPDGTTISSGPSGNRTSVDVSGMSYKQAYDQGLVEPTHYSGYVYRHTSASTGTPFTGVFTQSWIALREVSLSYNIPNSFLEKMFINNASLSLTGRDLGFLYNSMPDNINPTISNNAAANPLQMRSAPYIGSVTFAVKLNF